MNNARRKRIKQMLDIVTDISHKCDTLSSLVQDILDEESESLSNMPENLEGSDRWQSISDAVDNLEDARDSIDEIIGNLSSVESGLQKASE